MFGSPILDVIVALAVVYFALSTLASHINEKVAGLLSWRSKDLERGIRNLLAEPNLALAVWQHPLISGLAPRPGRSPSYVPATTFALALFDTISPGTDGTDPAQLRVMLANLPDTSARRALLSIYDAAGGDVTRARQGVEAWFNGAMDRLSGEYKRRLQWLTLLVAAIIATLVGADTIAIAQTLWSDEALRSGLVAAAQSQSSADSRSAINALGSLNLPLGWSRFPESAQDWGVKAAGLLITTFAISLGAPFWFDLLGKFVNPRAAGPKPARDPVAAGHPSPTTASTSPPPRPAPPPAPAPTAPPPAGGPPMTQS